jgi:hypothetical protein
MTTRRNPALLFALLLACSALAFPLFQKEKKEPEKKQEQQKTEEQKKQEQQPAPLFAGKGGLKSSRQEKDSATLGFSGVGPNGEVEQAVLNATPTSADQQKAYEMGKRGVAPDALQMFILEGQLNPQGAPKSGK